MVRAPSCDRVPRAVHTHNKTAIGSLISTLDVAQHVIYHHSEFLGLRTRELRWQPGVTSDATMLGFDFGDDDIDALELPDNIGDEFGAPSACPPSTAPQPQHQALLAAYTQPHAPPLPDPFSSAPSQASGQFRSQSSSQSASQLQLPTEFESQTLPAPQLPPRPNAGASAAATVDSIAAASGSHTVPSAASGMPMPPIAPRVGRGPPPMVRRAGNPSSASLRGHARGTASGVDPAASSTPSTRPQGPLPRRAQPVANNGDADMVGAGGGIGGNARLPRARVRPRPEDALFGSASQLSTGSDFDFQQPPPPSRRRMSTHRPSQQPQQSQQSQQPQRSLMPPPPAPHVEPHAARRSQSLPEDGRLSAGTADRNVPLPYARESVVVAHGRDGC